MEKPNSFANDILKHRCDAIWALLCGATMLLVSIGFGIAAPGTARAANIVVNTLNDEAVAGDGLCSLREAVDNANSPNTDTTGGDCATGAGNDTITFRVSGTIILTAMLPPVTNTLEIDGGGTIAIDGADSYQVLQVNPGATLELNNATVEHARGNSSGAIYVAGSNFTPEPKLIIDNCDFTNNATTGIGGAIYGTYSSIIVTDSTFSHNSASNGGAIYLGRTRLTLTDDTFSDNTAVGSGIIASSFAGISTANSTFYQNTADAVISTSNSVSTIGDSTFAYNYGIAIDGQFVTISDSIFAKNMGGNCIGSYLQNGGYNIADDNTCDFGNTTGANDQSIGDNVNPLLDPNGLQNNGGPTETIALQPNSPAVDAIPTADCPTSDERGLARPDDGEGACDIGAYESGYVSFASFNTKLDIAPSSSSFDLKSDFTLTNGASPVIDPLDHEVTLDIGSYSVTIPKGSFSENKKGDYVFEGNIGGASLQIRIAPGKTGGYTFQAEGSGANLSVLTEPFPVLLSIGDEFGYQPVTADFS